MVKGNTKKNIALNLFWKFGERVLAQGISFIVSLLLARILLPSEYGVVSLVMIFIVFADVFVVSGFSTSLIQKKDADELDFSTIFYCSLFVSILIYIILFFLAPYIADFYAMPILKNVLRVFALRIPLSALNSIQHAYVSRHMLFKKFFFSTLFGTLISGIVGIVIALLGGGVWALVAQYMTNTIVDSLVLLFTISWRPKWMFSMSAAKSLMNYGWKVLAADFSGTFFNQLRTLIVGKFYAPDSLAYYDRGNSFASLATENISTAVMSVLFPAFSNESENIENVKYMLRKALSVMSYILFPIIVGLVLVANPLVDFLLTDKWAGCVPFIQVLSLSALISLVGNVSLQAIKAIGRSDILLRLEFIKKPVYLILLFIGVKFSVFAVAVTMLIYSFYSTFINVVPLKHLVNYKYSEQLQDVCKPLFITLLMAGLVFLCSLISMPSGLLLIVQIVVGMISYVLFSILFKVEEFNILKSMIFKG